MTSLAMGQIWGNQLSRQDRKIFGETFPQAMNIAITKQVHLKNYIYLKSFHQFMCTTTSINQDIEGLLKPLSQISEIKIFPFGFTLIFHVLIKSILFIDVTI